MLDSYSDMGHGGLGLENFAGPTIQQLLGFLQAGATGHGMAKQALGAVPIVAAGRFSVGASAAPAPQ